MHCQRSQSRDLEAINLELEKTFCTLRHIASKAKIEDKIGMNLEQQPQAHQEKSFKDYFSPLDNLSTSCIRYPNVVARSFELKPSVLNCFLSFNDLENEDLYNHLNDPYAVCQSFNYENFSYEDVKLKLFPFSLKDRACSWFNILSVNSITSWEQMVTKFLNKYFPVHKTNIICREILKFTQREDDQFSEA